MFWLNDILAETILFLCLMLLCYLTFLLPGWPDINTSCNVARERVSVVRVDHWAETSSHLWRRPSSMFLLCHLVREALNRIIWPCHRRVSAVGIVEVEFSNFVIMNANDSRHYLMARSQSWFMHSAMNGMCIQVSESISDIPAALWLAIAVNLMLISFVTFW